MKVRSAINLTALAAAICMMAAIVMADDSAALQKRLDAGGAITGLTGSVGTSLHVHANTTITGCKIVATNCRAFLLDTGAADISITGSDIKGGGVEIHSGVRDNITGNAIHDIPQGGSPAGCGIYFDQLSASHIDGNTITNTQGDGGIFGYTPDQCTFDGNTFSGNWEAMHIFWASKTAGKCSVSHNNVVSFFRHGIELQGDPKGLLVEANNAHDPQARNSHIWISVATGGDQQVGDQSSGVIIRNNIITGPKGANSYDPPINYTGLEAMGDGVVVEGNFVANVGYGCLVGINPHGGTFTNNTFAGCKGGTPYSLEYQGVKPATETGNIIKATWDGTIPAASPATLPAAPVATDLGGGKVRVTWVASGKPAQLTIRPTRGTGTVDLGSALAGEAVIANVPANWEVIVSVNGVDAPSVQAHGGPTTPIFAPTLGPIAPPATLPVVPDLTRPATQPIDVTVHFRSLDGGATWTVVP